MHKKSFVFCGLALIFGCFGAFFRWLQNANAFEPETGLSITGSFWNWGMVVFLVVCAAGLYLLLRPLQKLETAGNYPDAFRGGPAICSVSAIASAALIVTGGILAAAASARTISGGTFSRTASPYIFDLVEAGFAIIAAACIFFILRGVNSAGKVKGGILAVPTLYLCMRLIGEYKVCASDPVIWHFAIRILAVCAMLLAFYYLTGFAFGKAKPIRALYFSLLAVVLCVTTFADSISLAYHLTSAGISLALLTFSLLLVGNMTPMGAAAVTENDTAAETDAGGLLP